MEKTGQCLCGVVTFTARTKGTEFGACHCEMCRRWTGSAFLGLTVPVENIVFTGEDNITRLQSSEWAERAFCSKCGSGLWYRVTAESPMAGTLELPIGLLDGSDELTMTREIFIDKKPASFSYTGEHKLLTEAEVFALYGVNQDGD